MRRFLGLALAVYLAALPVYGETSTHERTGVSRGSPLAFALDFDADLLAPSEEGGLRLDASLAFELMYRSSLCLMASLPCGLLLIERTDGTPSLEAATGDPGLDLDLSFRWAAWRFSTGLGFTLSVGPTQGQTEIVASLRRGCPSIALKAGIVRFLDPLVLGLAIDCSAFAPRAGPRARITGPLSLSLRLSASEVLNSRLALNLSLSQGFKGPSYADGIAQEKTWTYSATASAIFSLNLGDSSLRVGFSRASGVRLGASWTGGQE